MTVTEDGWVYCLHGWAQVVTQVLHVDLTAALFARLDEAASMTRTCAVQAGHYQRVPANA